MKRLLVVLGCACSLLITIAGINYRFEGWVLQGYTFISIGIWSSLLFLGEIKENRQVEWKKANGS